ncbi:hypothetical protein AALO_G00226870 [Alosa alosa]|uniref:Inhibitor of nuclear factor kappa-B kinase-interacting protein n=1 Tax=Alosa alosa TaxID=278164 RepID=A0AAV6G1R2_9TELE|nr:hypothetical protein AALO_G00226870 [Alosa alosa]
MTMIIKCQSLLAALEKLESEAPPSQVASLEQEISRLTAWSSEVSARRQQAQEKLSALGQAVESIGERTSSITRDMSAKVAAVRTDVRRMGGLETDVESLLNRTGELEDALADAERTMVKRMAELLASSIDRVSSMKGATERNAQRLDQLRRRFPELQAADSQLSERILALESGRARLMRTVTFAGDLKPKVFTIQRDFNALEPRLDDLTLRIGQLAEDLMKSEKDLKELKEGLASLNVTPERVTTEIPGCGHDDP